MHTITSNRDFDIDGHEEEGGGGKKSKRMLGFGGQSKKKKSDVLFDEVYHQKMTFTVTDE